MEQRFRGLLVISEDDIQENVGNYPGNYSIIFSIKRIIGKNNYIFSSHKFKHHHNVVRFPLRDASIPNSRFVSFVCTFVYSSFNKHFLNIHNGSSTVQHFSM